MTKKRKREGGDKRVGPLSAPNNGEYARVDQLAICIQNCKI
jgi:hypothetical protein